LTQLIYGANTYLRISRKTYPPHLLKVKYFRANLSAKFFLRYLLNLLRLTYGKAENITKDPPERPLDLGVPGQGYTQVLVKRKSLNIPLKCMFMTILTL